MLITKFIKNIPTEHGNQSTCDVEGEEKEKQAREEIAEEGDHPTGDALWNGVNCLNEKLKEDGNAAVDEDAHQDTGGIQRS